MIDEIDVQFYFFLGLFIYGSVLCLLYLIFYLIGWIELSKLYKSRMKTDDSIIQKCKTCKCNMGKNLAGNMGGTTIAFLDKGLYLNPEYDSFPILRNLVPALLIPWQEIRKYEIIEGQKYYFYLGNPMITLLSLDEEKVIELERLSDILVSDRIKND